MAIANGSTISEADLDAMITASLALLQADNGQVPGGLELHFQFNNVVTTTAALRRTAKFLMPFDGMVESIAIETGDMTAASTTTATLAGLDGEVLSLWPATVSVASGAGNAKGARKLYDGTKQKISSKGFATTAQPVRTLLKGDPLEVVVVTTSVATPSMCHVVIVLREFLARE